MTGKFLIDATEARFHIAANQDVLDFVRRKNPFAHSDVGSLLLALGKAIPGAHAYSPSYAQCAYVVLHTDTQRIVAMAFGQRGLAFRLSTASRVAALADGGIPAVEIGPDWVSFVPWDTEGTALVNARLQRWCAQAFADAVDPAPT